MSLGVALGPDREHRQVAVEAAIQRWAKRSHEVNRPLGRPWCTTQKWWMFHWANNITLLRAIPTMTFQDVDKDIYSDICPTFYLTYILTFYFEFYLRFSLTVYLTSFLTFYIA